MHHALMLDFKADFPRVDAVVPLRIVGFDQIFGLPAPPEMPTVTLKLFKFGKLPSFWKPGPFLFGTPEMMALIRNSGETHVEDFPVRIVDKRGRQDNDSYRLIHPVGNVACLDRERSVLTLDADGQIDKIQRLALDESKIPPDRTFFRLAEYELTIVVAASLAEAMLEHGAWGLRPVPISEYSYPGF